MKTPSAQQLFELTRYDFAGAPPMHCMVFGPCTKTVTYVTYDQLPWLDRQCIKAERTICRAMHEFALLFRARRR